MLSPPPAVVSSAGAGCLALEVALEERLVTTPVMIGWLPVVTDDDDDGWLLDMSNNGADIRLLAQHTC